MMSDHPILFSSPMIRALLDGRKTQTRRVLKPQVYGYDAMFSDQGKWWTGDAITGEVHQRLNVPYAIGDHLWVREAHYLTDDGDYEQVVYAVDTDAVEDHLRQMDDLARRYPLVDWSRHRKLRPSIHMPRWASRLTLIVTDVRVQRVQEIGPEDAHDEGTGYIDRDGIDHCAGGHPSYSVSAFQDLWNSLNASRGYGWDANPWVVALTFTVRHENIDTLKQAT